MSLGINIRNKRVSLKFSQEYVAEKLNVSRQAVSKWETDQSEPSTNNLIKLAELFNCEVNEIIAPETCIKDKKSEISRMEQMNKDKKMQLSAFYGRILTLISFLGGIGAYSDQRDLTLNWYWGSLFILGLGLILWSSRDYFHRKSGPKKIVILDLLFSFTFFLYFLLPFARGISTLCTLMCGALLLIILNNKFFLPVWRTTENKL
ncbi:helix-turn-helix domain-containing protein [Radiobacillus deserti]|uniref:Helix-turn-helix transcriptional regulator n=1 Tax=Radiobacillus deserti TaxID=2594883 RepID=A0A516KJJ1_9BACI|nr:helix-turn-helix transcriptional regulator [Radiobacillus deserti]QDP41552.1 helix-turn-helix transcriptional regulator [Radiobacillus deserti]